MQNSQENLLELPKNEEEKLLLVTQIYCVYPRWSIFLSQASEKELCNPLVPIQGLADILDLLPLSSCEILFKAVEREVFLYIYILRYCKCNFKWPIMQRWRCPNHNTYET